MKNKSCAIIAEPPMCFAWGLDEEDEGCAALKLLMLSEVSFLQTQGITQFVVPMDAGAGLYAAEAVNGLRKTNTELQLLCCIPHEEQAVKWPPNLRERYYEALGSCTEPVPVSVEKTPTCELDAMLEAIDRSEAVIAVCGAEKIQDTSFATALRYAEKRGREVTCIRPPKLF